MSRSIWRVERNAVTRAGVVIATLLHLEGGGLGWRGFGIERVGFESESDVVEDVKYFHRHPPVTRITFQGGKSITL